jgi:transcriptional regulator
MSDRKAYTTVTPEMKIEMQALRDEGKTLKDIADQFNVTAATVGNNTTNPKIAEMQKMRDKGAASDRIARKFGVTREYVLENTKGNVVYERVKEEARGGTLPTFLTMEEPIKIGGRGKDPEPKSNKIPLIVGAKAPREKQQPNYPGKEVQGKPRLSLVSTNLIRAVGAVRTYGSEKYGSDDNYKRVPPQYFLDALLRHLYAYMDDETARDEESGLPHLWHVACNVSFLLDAEDKSV